MKKQLPVNGPINAQRMANFGKTQAESYHQHRYDLDGSIGRMEQLLGFAGVELGPVDDPTFLPSDKNAKPNDPELLKMTKAYELRNVGYYRTGRINKDGSVEVMKADGKLDAIWDKNVEMTL